ncbi:MAG TPA: hypothetical protein VLJ59_16005 [Mycobacteriales bacterium]|nr:hypothetical protein [Mycobacteriales bacterium]
MTEDGMPVGYLATRVQMWWTRHGWWPFHRYIDPVERPEWLLTFAAPVGRLPYDDGVVIDVAAEIDDWDNGRFAYRRQVLTLRWLHGPDADTTRAAYGWQDADG